MLSEATLLALSVLEVASAFLWAAACKASVPSSYIMTCSPAWIPAAVNHGRWMRACSRACAHLRRLPRRSRAGKLLRGQRGVFGGGLKCPDDRAIRGFVSSQGLRGWTPAARLYLSAYTRTLNDMCCGFMRELARRWGPQLDAV